MSDLPYEPSIIQYNVSSLQTDYGFNFYAPLKVDIDVYYQAASATPIPIEDVLVLDTDYTVTYNADPTTGGFITLLFSPLNGYILTLVLDIQPSLDVNFSDARNFNGADLDRALDRLLLLCQQNDSWIKTRNLSYLINANLVQDPTLQTQLPVLAENNVWIGTGDGVIAGEISEVPSASLLRSQLANASPGTDGARLVGYWDADATESTTVQAFLAALPEYIANIVRLNPPPLYPAGGTGNAITITPTHAYTSYFSGMQLNVLIASDNTIENPTINVSGLGAQNIALFNGYSPLPGDLSAGMVAQLIYDGAKFQLMNPALGWNRATISGAATMQNNQTLNASTGANISFDSIIFDPFSLFNTTTHAFTTPYQGKYLFILRAYNTYPSGASGVDYSILDNAANKYELFDYTTSPGTVSTQFSGSVIVNAMPAT